MGLTDLVLSLADNKQLLGLRYAEWATRAPSLEADIAAAAMGLDELGHSRVLYGCLEPLGEDPRGPERETDPGGHHALPYFDEPWTSWPQFVAANAVLDTAFSVMIEAGIDEAPLNEAWREALEWFGPPEGDVADLRRLGALSMGPAELAARLEERLERAAPRLEIDWSTWDPARRRGRPGSIDPRTFGMLRGLEEKRFYPAGA